ncbi:MAG: amino acid adenylation domain-containing protein [Tahibacter sp.]
MSILALIAELRANDIKLYLDAGKLRINAPKGAMTPEMLDRIKIQKLEITAFLEEIAQHREGQQDGRRRIPQRPADAPLLASFAQQRLWFLDQLEGAGAAYNMPAALRFRGPLNVTAMRQALQSMVQRHEILRTRFEAVNGEPRLSIAEHLDVPLNVSQVDEGRILEMAREHARHRFDLSRLPLIIVDLLRVDTNDHVLLLNIHHIICDGWSLGVLVQEWVRLYAAVGLSGAPPLPALQVQYADYAQWQRNVVQATVLDRQLDYWKKKLDGAPELLNLPTDRPRPPIQQFDGGREEVLIGTSTLRHLRQLCQEAGASMFMLLLSAFGLLMSRYSGDTDILVGTPFVNRDRQELEGLIGLFLHSLVLRIDVAGEPRFRELLDRVRQTALESYANSDVPFERIVEALPLQRDLSRNPLFQVFFNMLNLPESSNVLPGLDVEGLQGVHFDAKFDLTLYAQETAEGLRLNLAYNAVLFDAVRMRELLRQFTQLLEQIVARPDAGVETYSLLTEPAKSLLPDPTVELDNAWIGSVQDMFVAQVERNPDAVALTAHGICWSYRELHDYSERIACWLQNQGIVAGDIVAICAARNAELPAAVLGVMKAGAVFMILDPAYPVAHLAACLEVAPARAWLSVADPHIDTEVAHLRDGIEAVLSIRDISRNTILKEFSGRSAERVVRSANDIALIAITSGSAGKPKAVESRHGPLTHYLPWVVDTFGVESDDRISMLSGLAHDPLQRDMFTAFCLGASLHVPLAEDLVPERLRGWMDEQRISVVNLTPAMAQLLCENADDGTLAHLHHAFLVGDVLTRRDVQRLQELAPSVRIVSYYGATETQRAFGYYDLGDGEDAYPQREIVPLGRGIRDVQLLVMNAGGQQAGIGECGEIVMRSPQLAGGYRNDPELTAARFQSNPFSQLRDDRMYRTGDLGRYLPNGMVEGLGRADTQVKLRGFRIELGHVESALGQHPDVREALVTLGNHADVGKYLLAYIVSPRALSVGELREHLRGRLPDYMQPSTYLFLEQLPLTPNGKVDRRALPIPESFAAKVGFVAPTSKMEHALCDIWESILKRDKVGCADNFFEIGGHSLLATQVVSKVRQSLGIELSLRQLFDTPVLGDLAAVLAADSSRMAVSAIQRRPGDGPSPLSFAQQRLWFLAELEGPSATYNMPAALRLCGALDASALRRSVQTIVDRHENLRTRFDQHEGRPAQIVAAPSPVQIAVLDVPAEQVESFARRHATRCFDLRTGPLFDVCVLRVAADDHVLLLNTHHIVSDAWSMGVLVDEFSALYEAFVAGRDSPLAELPIQYADFAHWQRQWMQGDVLDEQASFWSAHLADSPPLLQLPTDRPRPALQSFEGAQHRFQIDADVAAGLVKLGQGQGATLFMTLLAAFQILLARYSGQDDIAVGTPIANRTHAELEPLIGFFVNTLVLRSRIDLAQDFCGLLSKVRASTLAAYENQHFPFEQLVELLRPERNLAHSPLFQVMFVMQNERLENRSLPGLELSALVGERTVAKFDLTLTMAESVEGLAGTFEYNTQLFDADTIHQLQKHFCKVLRDACSDPRVPLLYQSMLDDAEVAQQVENWNDTFTDNGSERFVHDLIAEVALRDPTAIAVDSDAGSLSYRELDRRANRLAHYLRSQRIGAESVIGLCFDGCADMVVAILAVFKAGAAYLPLDPAHPDARLANAMSDAGVRHVLTQSTLCERGALHGSELLVLDRDWQRLDDFPDTDPGADLQLDNLAYLIYTSGSTGRPKGVQISHRGLCNVALAFGNQLGLVKTSRFLQFAAFGFDASVLEILAALCAGACLCVADRERRMPGAEFVAWLNEKRIDGAILSPSVLAQLSPQDLPSLRTVVSAGEACTTDIQSRWSRGRHFVNAYGPSETTVCASLQVCAPEQTEVSIGKPLANVELFVLDTDGMLVPPGVVGELCIAGVCVARGYRGQADLTAERFLPHPYAKRPGDRIYRSGDRVRHLKDGSLEFLGRIDQQIKLRGFRIEIGEIEHALVAQDGIREAVVLLKGESSDKRLVAYIASDADLDVTQLRQRLSERMPAYMLPSAIVVLDQMPLTPNGKIDRKALSAADTSAASNTYVAPRNTSEQRMADIWREVLNTSQIGINDNFFEIGGHSLLTILLASRIRDEFGVELPVHRIFAMPTIAEMVAGLSIDGRDGWSPLVLLRGGHEDSLPLFIVHSQGGSVLLYADLARAMGDERPIYGLQSLGLEPGQSALRSVAAMASLYIAAIRQAQPQGPYHLAGYSLGGTIALEMARQFAHAGDDVAFLGLLDTAPPGDQAGEERSRAYLLAGVWGYTLGFVEEDLAGMSSAEQVEFVLRRAIAAGSVPPDYGPEDAQRLIRVIEANSLAVSRYTANGNDNFGAAVLFRATEHQKAKSSQRWRDLLGERLRIVDVPGDHLSMIMPPQVQILAARVTEALANPHSSEAFPPKCDREELAELMRE